MALHDAKKFVDRVATDKAFRSKLGAALQPFLQAAKENGYDFSLLTEVMHSAAFLRTA